MINRRRDLMESRDTETRSQRRDAGGFVVRLLPIVYPGLPEVDRFLAFCREASAQAKAHPLLKHYGVSIEVAEELLPYCAAFCESIIPPQNLRYNALDSWLTTDGRLRWRLDLLWTATPVAEGAALIYPALDPKDVVLALIPASVDTTPELWATEMHFRSGAAWMGPYRSKAMVLIYHVRVRGPSGEASEESFRDLNAASLAADLVENIATQQLSVPDPLMEVIRIEFGYETRLDRQRPEVGDRLRALYFGDSFCTAETLKRSLLLFDDLHFHDRPSLVVGDWGVIGSPSEARHYALSFAKAGVPVLVHRESDVLRASALDAVASDLVDREFSRIFFDELRSDPIFRSLFLPEAAQYGSESGAHSGKEIADAMLRQDLGGRAYDLDRFRKASARPFDPTDRAGLEHTFVRLLVSASLEISLCCVLSHENDLIPLTEIQAFNRLLARRHTRALQREGVRRSVSPTLPYLSFRVLDRMIPAEVLERVSVAQVVELRKATRGAYASFRDHLLALHSKLDSEEWNEQLEREVDRLLRQEVIPLAQDFESESSRIIEELLGSIYKEAVKSITPATVSTVALNALLGLSWAEILVLGCALMASKVLPHLRDVYQESRNLRRRNALTYLMELRKRVSDK
jgi:hypothetical protein